MPILIEEGGRPATMMARLLKAGGSGYCDRKKRPREDKWAQAGDDVWRARLESDGRFGCPPPDGGFCVA